MEKLTRFLLKHVLFLAGNQSAPSIIGKIIGFYISFTITGVAFFNLAFPDFKIPAYNMSAISFICITILLIHISSILAIRVKFYNGKLLLFIFILTIIPSSSYIVFSRIITRPYKFNQSFLNSEQIREGIFEIDLLRPSGFKYLTYPREKQNKNMAVGPNTKMTPRGVKFVIQNAHNMEIELPVRVPKVHLGHVLLLIDIHAVEGTQSGLTQLFLMRPGREAIALDSLYIGAGTRLRYQLTGIAGDEARLVIKTQAMAEKAAILELTKLELRSVPRRGTIVMETVQSWDGKPLDGDYHDTWFHIFRHSSGERLYLKSVKMGSNGYTIIDGLQDGKYVLEGGFHSMRLGITSVLDLGAGFGEYTKFLVESPVPVRVKVISNRLDISVDKLDVVVVTGQSESDLVRGGMDERFRLFTNSEGECTVWLFGSLRNEDYYVFRILKDGKEIARKNYFLALQERSRSKTLEIKLE